MAAKERESAPGAPIWMLTFSDSMTNLLTFFILLLTFASFGELTTRLSGTSPKTAGPTVHGARLPPKDALVPAGTLASRQTKPGSERYDPSADRQDAPRPRRPLELLDADAYRDRHVFYLPSRTIFWGVGTHITEEGQKRLSVIADFLRVTRCRVIISESSAPDYGGHALLARQDRALERACAVMEYFTDKQYLPVGRFAVAAASAQHHLSDEPMVEIVLLTRNVCP